MTIVGIIIFTLAMTIWMYCHFSLNTLRGNMPAIAHQFGALIYLVPIILGIIGISMAQWHVLIGIPLGWALFTFGIYRWLIR